jgi:hypothetical protein
MQRAKVAGLLWPLALAFFIGLKKRHDKVLLGITHTCNLASVLPHNYNNGKPIYLT